jgi:hypothetical protein
MDDTTYDTTIVGSLRNMNLAAMLINLANLAVVLINLVAKIMNLAVVLINLADKNYELGRYAPINMAAIVTN